MRKTRIALLFSKPALSRHLERRKHHKLVFSKPKPDHREGKPP